MKERESLLRFSKLRGVVVYTGKVVNAVLKVAACCFLVNSGYDADSMVGVLRTVGEKCRCSPLFPPFHPSLNGFDPRSCVEGIIQHIFSLGLTCSKKHAECALHAFVSRQVILVSHYVSENGSPPVEPWDHPCSNFISLTSRRCHPHIGQWGGSRGRYAFS